MDDYRQYLAQKILTEDQPVTYRLLSRALKVHVNTAKEMLYEFHQWQNAKRPSTLHATYLVYGTKKTEGKQQDGDVEMTDSQTSEDFHVPYSDAVPTNTLSLVREEDLQHILAQFVEVTSIHVYSLAPHPLKDLQLLADTARQVMEISPLDSASASDKVFGGIANPHVRRRERRGGAKPAAASAAAPKPDPKPQVKPEVKAEIKPTADEAVKEESKAPTQASSKTSSTSGPAKKPAPASTLKRQGSSGIGQMFAKAAAKPKKPATKAADSGANSAAASGAEDAPPAAMSDDGEDDTVPAEEVKKEDSGAARQARKEREERLRQMMDESDEEEPEKAESPVEEPMEEDTAPAEPEPESESMPKADEPAEVVSSTGGGRRRGRRRVTRKKQIMDEQGYLVTIQEPGWESFSEDEAPPPKPKAQPVKSEPAAKPKKPAGKGGQGNIMSFFSKK
ncbi:hypothetical protein F4780DRAFT_176439 [Xylariomycetidae sp. FL0641]|nr:hypothetical protein F4780DRAFT_176439 [Xylariomycetidae sp. FL0641]